MKVNDGKRETSRNFLNQNITTTRARTHTMNTTTAPTPAPCIFTTAGGTTVPDPSPNSMTRARSRLAMGATDRPQNLSFPVSRPFLSSSRATRSYVACDSYRAPLLPNHPDPTPLPTQTGEIPLDAADTHDAKRRRNAEE